MDLGEFKATQCYTQRSCLSKITEHYSVYALFNRYDNHCHFYSHKNYYNCEINGMSQSNQILIQLAIHITKRLMNKPFQILQITAMFWETTEYAECFTVVNFPLFNGRKGCYIWLLPS